MSVHVTAEEKTNKKNDVKVRSLLLTTLPNEYQLTFSQYNDAKTITVSPNVNTASPQVSSASFSDNDVYAFMVENPNGSNIIQHDLEQIHEDDLEAMDLKCGVLTVTRWDTFQGNVEHQGTKRSEMAEEQVQTNMALMAFSDSENEVLFSKEVAVLKRELACKDYEINVLKSEFEKVKQEKEGIEFKIEKFDNASKSLNKLLENPEFKSYGSEDSKQESNIVCDKKSDDSKENSNDSLVKEQVSKDTSSFDESSLNVDKETIFLVDKKIEFVKPKNHEKPVKKSVRGGAHGGRISGKGTLKTDSLDFEDAYFINELKFNLFSILLKGVKIQLLAMYRITSSTFKLPSNNSFKLPDESQILLKIPRKDNMYSFEMKNIVPKETLTRLVVNATSDESMLWHRRLGHINFKNINKLVKDNLVRGKQHRAFCKSKVLNPITKPLFMLHMDLFGPTFMSSLMHKKYCLVVTDDYSSFTWVFFLTTKDETSEILKNFIKEIENLVDKKVKIIRSDNGTEFKNKVMGDFYRENGIRREHSIARTPQQNGVAERRNMTLIEAARTMVLVVKPHNKTPYELFRGFKPTLSFMRPFGSHVTILNTLDNLGKFDGKSDEGFFVGYSLSSKAFRVYNTRTRRVEENLHIGFLENKPMIEGNGPKWLFNIDSLTQSMNYVPVVAGTITNESTGTQGELNAVLILVLYLGSSVSLLVLEPL
ncbi:putative ribonuclease H-like domain-containing protein [Tanacetum coccineum]